ncbi:MAG TPA: hypothetical protein DCE41_36625 [Cytophagales bacterium]|nr:hypothetical protein [Cytophagales bacterium]HAA21135.1 hypothetical protein [Cytophagales bacterium]HAP61126.1 hypothetical protein [Cytophagales bacterium]
MSNILNPEKLMMIVEGDVEFLEEMKVAQIQTLEELRDSFADCLQSNNLDGLRSANHKAKPAIELLGADGLAALVQKGYQFLESGGGDLTIDGLIEEMKGLVAEVSKATQELTT